MYIGRQYRIIHLKCTLTRAVDKSVHIRHILNDKTFNLSVEIDHSTPKRSTKIFYISTSKMRRRSMSAVCRNLEEYSASENTQPQDPTTMQRHIHKALITWM